MKSKVYTEVIEVLKNIDDENCKKIPKEIIEYMKNNMDTDYKFCLDFEELNISRKACGILVSLYSKYIADSKDASIIKEILFLNYRKNEIKKVGRKEYEV